MNFDQAFQVLLQREGRFSNHPADPGGATMWGVTERVARAAGYVGAMEDLSQWQAAAIYRLNYWTPAKIDQLPEEVRYDVFDGAVNSGVSQSVQWLQKACGADPDGVVGPRTLAACAAVPGGVLAKRFNGHRLKFLAGRKTWPTFGEGWANRIANNLIEA